MQQLTTISEIAKTSNLINAQVKHILDKHEISPTERKKYVINGYTGHPYLLSQVDPILNHYRKSSVRPKPNSKQKTYTNEQICKVLRTDIKHRLNHKEIYLWSKYDWDEFNKLKTRNHV